MSTLAGPNLVWVELKKSYHFFFLSETKRRILVFENKCLRKVVSIPYKNNDFIQSAVVNLVGPQETLFTTEKRSGSAMALGMQPYSLLGFLGRRVCPDIEENLDGEREVDRPLHPGSAQFLPGGLTLASTVSSGPFPTPSNGHRKWGTLSGDHPVPGKGRVTLVFYATTATSWQTASPVITCKLILLTSSH